MSEWINRENRPRPTQFMSHQIAQRFFFECMGHQHWGNDDSKAGLTHSLTDGVIVGELVCGRLKPPILVRVSRDKAMVAPTHGRAGPSASPGSCRAGNDRALPWKTVATRSRPRQAAVETGDYANAGLRQGARQRSQIVRTNRHVAISHDDERMTRDWPHWAGV